MRPRRTEELLDRLDDLDPLDNRSFEEGYDEPADKEGAFTLPVNDWPKDPQ